MKRTVGLLVVSVLLTYDALLVPVQAHLTQSAGQYDIVVGFVFEPPITGQMNGVFVQIVKTDTKDPIEGLENTLRVTVSYGGKVVEPDLRPLLPPLGRSGQYVADIIPTQPGIYTTRIRGAIGALNIDKVWVMNSTSDIVRDKSDLEFPEKSSVGGDVSKALTDLQRATSDLQGQMAKLVADLRSTRESPTRQDPTLYALAIAGTVLGFLGTVIGVSSLRRRKSS